MAFYSRWAPYVPVAQRRAKAAREASKLVKKGQKLRPIQISSRAIATSFWGLAWCKNLEIYSDWANRIPRGRTYARNGSILDLQIETGTIKALVSGSSLYKVKITIEPLKKQRWQSIRRDCAQQVGSLLDLMRGKLPEVVLARLTHPTQGMFPSPKELKMQCSCPDYATMCKHIAATLYGVGHLLDSEPALFFKMRGVDQTELVSDAMTAQVREDAIGLNQPSDLAPEDLSAIFGIDLATTSEKLPKTGRRNRSTSASKLPKSASKRVAQPGAAGKSKTSKAKKAAAPEQRVKADSKKVASARGMSKPKPKPAKKVAQTRVSGARKQPAVAGSKTDKAKGSKKAKAGGGL